MKMQAQLGGLLLLVIVAVCSGARQLLQASNPIGGAVSAKYFYGAKNLNAPLLILDVNSLYFKGNHPYFYGMNGPDTDTEGKCAERCARTTGCNGFVSCPTKAGCGQYCKQYVQANPTLTSPTSGQDNYVNNPMPLTRFGAWTYPNYFMDGCVNTTNTGTTTGDKWNWGLCSLKTVADLTNVQFWPSTATSSQDGFVSGVLTKPSNCPAGLPYSVCGKCNKLATATDRTKCLNCAALYKMNNSIKEAVNYGDYNFTYDFCPRCFQPGRTATAVNTCLQCLQTENAKPGNGNRNACVV